MYTYMHTTKLSSTTTDSFTALFLSSLNSTKVSNVLDFTYINDPMSTSQSNIADFRSANDKHVLSARESVVNRGSLVD